MTKKLGIILTASLVGLGLLAWLFIASSKPLPGQKALQPGRDHKPEGTKLEYQFHPPTSGDHFASWITKGFYDEPRADGNLVHSQEHGYVIIWYDCEKKVTFQRHPELDSGSILYRFRIKSGMTVNEVYAHEEATPSAQPDTKSQSSMTGGSAGIPTLHFEGMPKSFSDGSCDSLKNELKDVLSKFGPHKMIVMPRPNMGKSLVLTAWGRMEKLDSVDKDKIREFINAFRDAGPEQTTEP